MAVLSIDDGQRVEVDVVVPEDGDALHHAVECRALLFVYAIGVVEVRRSINADANEKLIVSQKAPPGVIEERSIRLKRILNLLTVRVFCLQADNIFKVANTKKRGLPTLPGKLHFVSRLCLDVLLDIQLEGLGGHRPAWVNLAVSRVVVFLLEVKAVAAIQVADGADRLCHDVKAGVQHLDRHATPYTCPTTVMQVEQDT